MRTHGQAIMDEESWRKKNGGLMENKSHGSPILEETLKKNHGKESLKWESGSAIVECEHAGRIMEDKPCLNAGIWMDLETGGRNLKAGGWKLNAGDHNLRAAS